MIAFGKKYSLRVEDVYGLPDDMQAENVLHHFKTVWDEEIQRRGNNVPNNTNHIVLIEQKLFLFVYLMNN